LKGAVAAPRAGGHSSSLSRGDENEKPAVLVLVGCDACHRRSRDRGQEAELAGGDEAGEQFLRLANGELDRAYRLAGLFLRDRHEAEDATQEALLRAWRSASSLREPAGFQAWFDRILVNVCRDRLRRRGTVRLISMDDAVLVQSVRDPFRDIADRDEVLRALASLDDDLRILILLHYWADLTLDALAARMGWPVGTVKSRLHRALATMRTELAASPVPEPDR
jgi:RNA polymerase sigma-70 factor, ECF subfamily